MIRYKLINAALLSAITIVGCSDQKENSQLKVDFPVGQANLPVEVFPFNSLPLERLHEEAQGFFANQSLPPVAPVETVAKDLKPHAIRLIRNHLEIAKYVRPGDVFVSYEPILASKDDPMNILQKGIPHAGIVVKNRQGGRDLLFPQKDGEEFICHLDTSSGWDPSGCIFEGNTHFFRIENNQPLENKDKIIEISNAVFGNWNYDALFDLDVTDSDSLSSVAKKIESGEKTNLYCSELPFTLHSVAQRKLIFEPTTFGKTIEEYNHFIENYGTLFNTPITSESSVQSIIKYFGGFLPSTSILDNSIIRRFVQSAMLNPNGLTSSWSGVSGKQLAGMWVFMDEAKKKGSSVHYIGSFVADSYKTHSLPIDFYSSVSKMSELAQSIETAYQKSFFKEDSPYKELKIGFEKPSKVETSINFVMGREMPDFKGHTAASLSQEVMGTLKYLRELKPYIENQEIITTDIFANTCYNIEYLISVLKSGAYNLKSNIKEEEDEIRKAELSSWARQFFGDSSRLKLLSDEFQCFTANYQ